MHLHAATTTHFDLRLEVDGVLASWAVPKGPSMDPAVKRLAVQVEDHDLDHASYEGREGRHAKIVWDAGTLTDLTDGDAGLRAAIDAGHLKVRLDGTKLAGAFALTRARLGGDDRNWLLVKVADEQADPSADPVTDRPESVLSGRTLADLQDERRDEEEP